MHIKDLLSKEGQSPHQQMLISPTEIPAPEMPHQALSRHWKKCDQSPFHSASIEENVNHTLTIFSAHVLSSIIGLTQII